MKKRTGFFGARSGMAAPRRVLAVGPVLIGLAMLGVLGMYQPADADWCWGVPEGSEQWVCTDAICASNPVKHLQLKVWHSPTCCPHCEVRDSTCGC
ncbi:MAG: hypothetical protein AB1505_28730 [Candidatus Latescibacterota bacterium]